MKRAINIQFFILLLGTVFAWTNFINELFTWLNKQACQTGCTALGEVVNPFLTPCFYGALFFTAAFIFNLMLVFMARDKKPKEAEEEIK